MTASLDSSCCAPTRPNPRDSLALTETPGRYLLVAGERRWRAAGMAGLTMVAVVIRELTAERAWRCS